MGFKNSNCDESQKFKLWWNSTTQIVMKLKNSLCDETQKLKFWKLKNSNYDKTNKTLVVTKLKNLNCNKTQKLKLWQNKLKITHTFCVKTAWYTLQLLDIKTP